MRHLPMTAQFAFGHPACYHNFAPLRRITNGISGHQRRREPSSRQLSSSSMPLICRAIIFATKKLYCRYSIGAGHCLTILNELRRDRISTVNKEKDFR